MLRECMIEKGTRVELKSWILLLFLLLFVTHQSCFAKVAIQIGLQWISVEAVR